VSGARDPTALPILVVDDEPAALGLIALALRRAGFEAIEATSAAAALDVLEQTTVALVVSDVGMPGMSGIDLVRALRGRPETSTLPIILITGSGDDQAVIEGLEAGASDFLPKPIRVDELVARVRSQLRTQATWTHILQDELKVRSSVIAALGTLTLSAVPEEAAERIVAELSSRVDADFVSVAQVSIEGRMQELATYNRIDRVRRGGEAFSADLAAYLLGRAREGPWVEDVRDPSPVAPTAALLAADTHLVASAPIRAGGIIVGLFSIGAKTDDQQRSSAQAQLLASAIDYARILEAVAGPSIAGRLDAAATRARLERILTAQEFHMAVQPVVDLEMPVTVGYEALARFDDGVAPDLRFAEATRADLGTEFELAAIAAAVAGSDALPAEAFLSVNLSPQTLISRTDALRDMLVASGRKMVVELTEHAPIDDYAVVREAVVSLGDRVALAVDDAGAGYASLRHILELRPAFAKLDISLVRGIDDDALRQSLAAGLNYYALRTGCRLIAEGVETDAEAAALLELGIEFAQGYLFGRPEPLTGWRLEA
jgi:EAL domain-containing protein (putative c-di-GMP-specific phosphodiesterase class I)/DNA-binding response OmpR family regulator